MSNSPERPSGLDPYAPKWTRDQDALRPVMSSREDNGFGDSEPPIAFRRAPTPTPLIAPAPQPPSESRRSFISVRDVALLSVVSIVSAVAVIVFYKLVNDGPSTSTAPRLAASATRSIPEAPAPQAPAAPPDETSAMATTAVAAAP